VNILFSIAYKRLHILPNAKLSLLGYNVLLNIINDSYLAKNITKKSIKGAEIPESFTKNFNVYGEELNS